MIITLRVISSFLAGSLAAVALAACGEAGKNNPVVAHVGAAPVTQASLRHWMSSIAGGDYFESTGRKAPIGLVSDPANYSSCVSASERVGKPKFGTKPVKLTHAQRETVCKALYVAIKQQALAYIFSDLSTIQEGEEHGFHVSEGEVNATLRHLEGERFPKSGDLQTYIANHDWALSDELSLIKRNLFQAKLQAHLEQQLRSTAKGEEALLRAVVKRSAQDAQSWSARTTCSTGYVVPGCKEYTSSVTAGASPDQLLEQIAASG